MPKSGSRTIARYIVLLLLLAGLGLALFLATLDLNRYRDEISSTLSTVFDRPVSFTQIGFSLTQGLAVDCQNLEVAAGPDDPNSLTADHLYLKVNLLPLVRGELVLRELILDHPHFILDFTTSRERKGLRGPGRESGMAAQLGEIHLHEGSIDLQITEAGGKPARILFEGLDLMLEERSDNHLGVNLSSRLLLGKKEAEFKLQGYISGPDWPDWRDNEVELEFFGRNLPLRQLQGLFDSGEMKLAGDGDLSLSMAGSASRGLMFNSELTADQGSYSYQGSASQSIGRWQLQGQWQNPVAGEHHVRKLAIGHRDLHLAGSLALNNSTISASVDLHQTPFRSLLRLIPDSLCPDDIKTRLPQGQLSLMATLTGAPLEQLSWPAMLPRLAATAEVKEVSWQPPDFPLIEKGQGQIELAAGELSLKHFRASWQDRPQTLTGTVDLTGKTPRFNLRGQLDPPMAQVGRLLAERTTQPILLAGRASFGLHLKGTNTRPTLSLHADLGALFGEFGNWYTKPESVPGEALLKLSRTADGWELDDGQLQIDDQTIKITATGQNDGSFNLGLKTPNFDLAPLARNSRILARHNPRGAVAFDLNLSKTKDEALTVHGRTALINVGIHLTPILADINRANGTILFHGNGFKTVLVNAHLGESPINLQAELADFSAPALKLHLQGPSVRADELVFHSHLLSLRDLDGRLTIDAKGISFDRVKVLLDGGTDCIVTGAMHGWHAPLVSLAVDARYGNIDEVIALWQNPEPGAKQPPRPHPKKPGPTVIVDVEAAAGQINRLNFERATATVTSRGDGILTVFPLQFHVGDGYGTGQVVTVSSKERPTVLKVSGHLENFPASGVHKDLLQRDSLVTGSLRGDFYLEGLIGKGFTHTASGGISMEIKDGVLKKFQFLSKVFSLLNVSQLFTLRLPDMAVEGMPFQRTTGTFTLNQGLLHSEDLLVHSEAMDLSLLADYDILTNRIDGFLGVKPLKTVDKIITKIPIAGWLLTGEDKALLTAHFTIKGNADDPDVAAVPITSLSSKVFGIFKRVLTLPGEVITDPGRVILPQSVDPKE